MAEKRAGCPLERSLSTRAPQSPDGVHCTREERNEARKSWFRLLDEVAGGEVVLIEREGARLLLKRAEQGEPSAEIPDYRELIRVPDADEADEWGWDWDGSAEGLRPRRTEPEP